MNYTEFEKKVKTMSAHDIIMAMVEGLRSPRTEIDMGTCGEIRDGICFGCAATNAILNIMNANEEEVTSHITYRLTYYYTPLWYFEYAIDRLRRGWWITYNMLAKRHGFAEIEPIPGQKLPALGNDYTEEQLQDYVKLAKYQLTFQNQ